MLKALKSIDMFGAPLPTFKLKGKNPTRLRTYAGVAATLGILLLTLFFAILKLQSLMLKRSPSVNTFVERDAFGDGDVFETDSTEFMMAFAVEDYVTGEIR